MITCTGKSSLSPELQDFTTLIDLNASSHQDDVPTTNGVRSETALSAMTIFSSLLYSPINPQTCLTVTLLKLVREPRHVSAATKQA